MAGFPSDIEILANPGLEKNLTELQLEHLVRRIKALAPHPPRNLVENNPADFAVHYSRGEWQKARHLVAISKALREIERGKILRLILTAPPRHGKSEITSHWFPLWYLARNPTRNIGLVSYNVEQAEYWSVKIRDDIYRFGEDIGLSVNPNESRRTNWSVMQGGSVRAFGIKSGVVGKGADLWIIDDPVEDEIQATSKLSRDRMWEFYKTGIVTRIQVGTAIVCMHQRWHEDDLVGRLLKQPNHKWRVINFPAIAEKDDELGREEGEALWPQGIPMSILENARAELGPYQWAAKFQQRPSPEGGGIIKRGWWRYWKALPEFDRMIQCWDLSFGESDGSDYCVGAVLGLRGAETFLVDMARDRMNARSVMATMRSWQQTYPKAVAKVVEAAASGPAVVQMLRPQVPGLVLVPTKNKGTKADRLQSVVPLIEAGNVLLPAWDQKPWVGEVVEEFAAFTPSGSTAAHDDIVDAIVHGLRHLYPSVLARVSMDHEEALKPTGANTIQEMYKLKFQGDLAKKLDATKERINGPIYSEESDFQNDDIW